MTRGANAGRSPLPAQEISAKRGLVGQEAERVVGFRRKERGVRRRADLDLAFRARISGGAGGGAA
jgi:hypothetical protein